MAVEERHALETRYVAVADACQARRATAALDALERLAERSQPVICMPFAVCDDILRSDKYRTYHQRLESAEREPTASGDHADREIVGARLFPTYHKHIHYAALSPDGRGLSNYGAVAIRWWVAPTYLGQRASLLEVNSFMFFDRHSLGQRSAQIPLGFRAVWEDRMKLAATKLGPRLTAATAVRALADLLLQPGATRADDDFIEVAIYAEEGLDTEDVDLVTLQSRASTAEDSHRWELVKAICATRRITLVE